MSNINPKKQMYEFFNNLNGIILSAVEGPNDSKIYFWNVEGKCVISQLYADDNGWDVWLPTKSKMLLDLNTEVRRHVS